MNTRKRPTTNQSETAGLANVKKPFIKPELKRHDALPEVTGSFVGSFPA